MSNATPEHSEVKELCFTMLKVTNGLAIQLVNPKDGTYLDLEFPGSWNTFVLYKKTANGKIVLSMPLREADLEANREDLTRFLGANILITDLDTNEVLSEGILNMSEKGRFTIDDEDC